MIVMNQKKYFHIKLKHGIYDKASNIRYQLLKHLHDAMWCCCQQWRANVE